MLARLFLLFVLVPTADLVLLWSLFVSLPAWISLVMVLGTGALGAYFSRRQGSQVLREIRRELSDNIVPANTLIDGVMILLAGALLITPGLITDTFGFLLLIPYTRNWFRQRLMEGLKGYLKVKTMNFQTQWEAEFQTHSGQRGQYRDASDRRPGDIIDGDIIDGEIVEGQIVKQPPKTSEASQ